MGGPRGVVRRSPVGAARGASEYQGRPEVCRRPDRVRTVVWSVTSTTALMPRALGRWDLVLLKIVAIVNINNVPPVAVYGWASLGLWGLAFVSFFIPEAVAVLTLSRRYPGEG